MNRIIFSKGDKLCSDRLSFRSIGEAELELILHWRSQSHVYEHARNPLPPNRTEHINWYKKQLRRDDSLRMVISEINSGTDIGIVAVDYTDNWYVLSYYLGEENAQGKGYMGEALRTFLTHLSSEYGLESVKAEVTDDNLASIALIKKLGGQQVDKECEDAKTWLHFEIPLAN